MNSCAITERTCLRCAASGQQRSVSIFRRYQGSHGTFSLASGEAWFGWTPWKCSSRDRRSFSQSITAGWNCFFYVFTFAFSACNFVRWSTGGDQYLKQIVAAIAPVVVNRHYLFSCIISQIPWAGLIKYHIFCRFQSFLSVIHLVYIHILFHIQTSKDGHSGIPRRGIPLVPCSVFFPNRE